MANDRIKRSSSNSCCKPPLSVVNLEETSTRQNEDKRNKRSQTKSNLPVQMVLGQLSTLARGAVLILSAITIHSMINFRYSMIHLRENNSSSKEMQLCLPSELDDVARRSLSLNLGGGECLWQVCLF